MHYTAQINENFGKVFKDLFGGGSASLTLTDPDNLLTVLSEEDRAAVTEVLSEDPRPPYQSDPDREYGMEYGIWEIRFIVNDACGTLVVTEIQKRTI